MISLVAIVGPTGTGKTALSLYIAQRFKGEVICADSRTVYTGMDIGTAKPTAQERAMVPHHLLDIAEPGRLVNVAEFQKRAIAAIGDVKRREKLPILVGGSGLYIDSVLYNYRFPGKSNSESRIENQALSLEDLARLLRSQDTLGAERIDLRNRRRVERALETAGQARSKEERVKSGTLVLGLTMDKKLIRERIEHRIKRMLEEGLIDEVGRLGKKYGWELEALRAPAYMAFKGVAEGEKTIDEAAAEFLRRDMLLVKKQLTWFKRNPQIVWLDASQPALLAREAKTLVQKFNDEMLKDTR
jgi:tRNA dimethylallyltransferase